MAATAPTPASPDLCIPESSSTVDVRIIDPKTYGSADASTVFVPAIQGLSTFRFPSYVFLITNVKLNKHILFDLAMAPNWAETLPPTTQEFIRKHMPFTVEQSVQDLLDADAAGLGIKSDDISSVIWSHHHFDHRGDITTFPAATELIVGPGFQQAYAPYYPTNPRSSINETELRGRPVRELDDAAFGLRVGQFRAHDFFGDGSFYIVDAPGHTTGHLCALARVTPSPNATFVFMGGDCAHHPAIFRPTAYVPLPREIPLPAGSRHGISVCPGAWVQQQLHPTRSATEPFLTPQVGVNDQQPLAGQSVAAMQQFDADENVLVCIAHDASLLAGDVEFYPATLNRWKEREGLARSRKERIHWGFCSDFDLGSLEGSQA